jgi:hypothetical protein
VQQQYNATFITHPVSKVTRFNATPVVNACKLISGQHISNYREQHQASDWGETPLSISRALAMYYYKCDRSDRIPCSQKGSLFV